MKIFIIVFLFYILLQLNSAVLAKNKKPSPSNYLVYYGPWDDEKIEKSHDFELVIFHPGIKLNNITPEQIERIKAGRDLLNGTEDDVMVIAYVSIGEDEEAPPWESDDEKGKGPVFFSGGLKEGKNNYPPRYLDEISYKFTGEGFIEWLSNGLPSTQKGHDGLPDENGKWGSYFVNPGDGEWQNYILERMRVLSESCNVDGFFLDTIDTVSPWNYYSWAQKDMALFVKKIRDTFPDKYIIANRGLFLLESYPDLFRSSIDGLMFESFITEWDWYRKIGNESKYLSGNYDILKKYVLPNSLKSDGFHIFILNYLSPEQKDFYNILYDQERLLEGVNYSHYISTPELQNIYPPPDKYLSASENLPKIVSFNVKEIEKGKFSLIIKHDKIPPFTPGNDCFLDIRYGEKNTEKPFLNRVYIDYSSLLNTSPEITINSFGLDKNKTYYFYASIIGKNPSLPVKYKKAVLYTKNYFTTGLISLEGEGRDKSVYLSWKPPSDKSILYNVYMGESFYSMKKYAVVNGNNILIENLENNKPYYFSVAGVTENINEGNLSVPVCIAPKDCIPPDTPVNLNINFDNNSHVLHVSWNMVSSDDLAGYMVYCFPVSEKIRIPFTVNSNVSVLNIAGLERNTAYRVYVTSFDFNKNQSKPSEIKEITISE